MRKLLIIGAGMATASLLQELEEREHDFSIEVIGDEPSPSYNRILLSSILSGDSSPRDLALLSDKWYQEHRITLHTGESAVRIDTARRRVRTSAGRDHCYDVLVFATGSRPLIPEVAGMEAGMVTGFRNQMDLERIHSQAERARHAVVIGGGLLGLEAANGLNKLGLKVTVVNRGPWLMQRQLDEMGGLILQQQLQKQGIAFRLASHPTALRSGQGRVKSVTLNGGESLPCDMVLVTAGIVPNRELAQDAGIPVARGILVNGLLQTGTRNIYALGECCEIDGRTFGLVAPVKQQARILAATLTGQSTEIFQHRETPVKLKIAGMSVVSAGTFPRDKHCQNQTVIDHQQGIYRRLVFENNHLARFVLIGDSRHSAWYSHLLEAGENVHQLKKSMMFIQSSGPDCPENRTGELT